MYRCQYLLYVYILELSYNIGQDMAKCSYCGQSMKRTVGMAAEMEREQRVQTGDKQHGAELDAEGEDTRGVQRTESAEEEPLTEKTVPESGLSSAETSLQLVNRGARKKVKSSFRQFQALALTQGSFVCT